MKRAACALAILGALLTASLAQAGPGRYALVIGVNRGDDALGLPDLEHAEDDAREIYAKLISQADFDPARVKLLVGGAARHDAILAAARTLGEQHAADRAKLADSSTLFVIYYTGHGVADGLVTADEPLKTNDLSASFAAVGASLEIGFFDACFSGRLADFPAKGFAARPYNPVSALPKFDARAEGRVLMTSSGPDELSFEDPEVGGLFTHYFLAAFDQVTPQGVALDLYDMWRYAESQTRRHASRAGRTQTPIMDNDARIEGGGIIFAVRAERSARLVLEAELEGEFLVRYLGDHAIVERLTKKSGEQVEVPIYATPLEIVALRGSGLQPITVPVHVEPGQSVVIQPNTLDRPGFPHGYTGVEVRSKGGWTTIRSQPAWTVSLTAGARGARPATSSPGAEYLGFGRLTIARGPWLVGLDGGYGERVQRFPSWAYNLRVTEARLVAGYGWDWGPLRAQVEAMGGMAYVDMHYGDGTDRIDTGWMIAPGLRAMLGIPFRRPWVYLDVGAQAQFQARPGLAELDRDPRWNWIPTVDIALTTPSLF